MLTNEQITILDYLADGKRRTIMEVASWCGMSTMRASVILRELVELGYLTVGTHTVFGKGKFFDYRYNK